MLAALSAVSGCEQSPAMGEVTGAFTVDGQTPADGSSITFFAIDGKSQPAGATIDQNRYTAQVPVGTFKVEIRVPRPAGGAAGNTAGPGSGGPGAGDAGLIEESLPAKYNTETELTIDVKPGKNNKNWDLSTK